MCIKRFISKNWPLSLWDLAGWIWNQKGRPVGWKLEKELTLMSWGRISSSSRKPQVLLLRPSSDCIRPPLRVVSSTSVLRMDVNHIHKIPSQQHLDENLVESLKTGLAKLTQKTWSSQYLSNFFLQKIPVCAVLLLYFTVHLNLYRDALSVGSIISEAYWCHMYMIDSREKTICFKHIKM